MSNEPLYTVRTKLTFEEYKKFNIAVWRNRKSGKFLRVIYTILYILLALELLLCLVAAAVFRSAELLRPCVTVVTCGAMIAFFNLIMWLAVRFSVRKAFSTDKATMDMEFTTRFYDDYMEEESEVGIIRLRYKEIYKVIETKTHIYIMQSTIKGYIFKKDECPDGLVEFINSLKK